MAAATNAMSPVTVFGTNAAATSPQLGFIKYNWIKKLAATATTKPPITLANSSLLSANRARNATSKNPTNAAAHGFVNYDEESGVPHLFTAFIRNICRGSFAYITAFLEVKINAPLLGCRRGPLRKVLYLLIGGEV
ncbi:MAG: hypothetical protein QW518_08230, partial [Thermofilaceae archaeon]